MPVNLLLDAAHDFTVGTGGNNICSSLKNIYQFENITLGSISLTSVEPKPSQSLPVSGKFIYVILQSMIISNVSSHLY